MTNRRCLPVSLSFSSVLSGTPQNGCRFQEHYAHKRTLTNDGIGCSFSKRLSGLKRFQISNIKKRRTALRRGSTDIILTPKMVKGVSSREDEVNIFQEIRTITRRRKGG
jgi:hypothetical protein